MSPSPMFGNDAPSTPPMMRASGLLGTPRAELLELSPSDVLRHYDATPQREGTPHVDAGCCSGCGSSNAMRRPTPPRSSRLAVLQARRGKLSEDDLLTDMLPSLKAGSATSASTPVAAKESNLICAPRSSLVRRISFSAPSAKAEAVRGMMEKARLAKFSVRRSTSPFSTIKPPPASLHSLRTINRMVNKSQRKLNPRAAARARVSENARAKPLQTLQSNLSPRAEAMKVTSSKIASRTAGCEGTEGPSQTDGDSESIAPGVHTEQISAPNTSSNHARSPTRVQRAKPLAHHTADEATSKGTTAERSIRAPEAMLSLPPAPLVSASTTSLPGGASHGPRSQIFGSFGSLTLVRGGQAKSALHSSSGTRRKIQLGRQPPAALPEKPTVQLARSLPRSPPVASMPTATDATVTMPFKLTSPKRDSPKRGSQERTSPRRSSGPPPRLSLNFKSMKPMAGGFKFTLGGAHGLSHYK